MNGGDTLVRATLAGLHRDPARANGGRLQGRLKQQLSNGPPAVEVIEFPKK